jgi:hypothetical protein
MSNPYCSYDEATGHYAYYAGGGEVRLKLPPNRGQFIDYREVEVMLPDDARPVGSGLEPKGLLVQPNQVFCMPPCQKNQSKDRTWDYFLWGMRFLFW